MMDRNQLISKLTNETKRLENKIEHRRLYNIRNAIMTALLKSGIAIDYALPFIVAAVITANVQASNGNAPFKVDNVTEKARIETIDTSNGIHIEHSSYDFEYDNNILEYSTGWIINKRGLYQRTVTSYKISNDIDLSDNSRLFAMSKEERKKILEIINIETIQKNTLSPEDYIYNEDALIIIRHTLSDKDMITRKETSLENFKHSAWFIFISLCYGIDATVLERVFVKTYVRDKLRTYQPLYKITDKSELEEMKRLLELKKQNLAMIMPLENTDNEENKWVYRLRRG